MLRRFSFDLSKIDRKQLATFSDKLLLVDSHDAVVGTKDKLTCHSWPYLSSGGAQPHRAFSICVFNSEDKLLLQQRSHKKVTWPLYWSNTCCSHPSADDSLDSFKQGISDRVKFELGFNLTKLVSPGDLKLVGKVLYKAKYDEYWGEYELDYVFFVKQNHIQTEAQIAANGDEVNSVKWVAQQELLKALDTTHLEFTPWFRKMVKHTDFMQKWSSLDCLEEILDPAIQELPSD